MHPFNDSSMHALGNATQVSKYLQKHRTQAGRFSNGSMILEERELGANGAVIDTHEDLLTNGEHDREYFEKRKSFMTTQQRKEDNRGVSSSGIGRPKTS